MPGGRVRKAALRIATVAATAVLLACGLNWGPVTASHDEYRLWRKIRLERSPDERARMLQRYLGAYSAGHFAKSATREEGQLDDRFYSAGMTDIEGLAFYLRLFPEGRHAEQARYRLDALVRVEEQRAATAAAAEERRREMEERLEERRRSWCTRTLETWLRVVAGIEGWGDPLDAVLGRNVTFATAWNGDPRPACEGDLCRKDLDHHFYIQVRGATRVDRDMKMRIGLRLRPGATPEELGRRLVGVDVTLPGAGLVACHELAAQTEVDPQDADGVAEARRVAADSLVSVVRAAFPEPPPPPPLPEGQTAAPVATAAPLAQDPRRIERLERPPLVVEFWRGADPAGSASPGLESEGVRISWEPPAPAPPARPGRRPAGAAPTKAPPPTKATTKAPAKVPAR